MLSKLRWAGHAGETQLTHDVILSESLRRVFGESLSDVQVLEGGTLSACFLGTLAGHVRVFKTHRTASGSEALVREASLLQAGAGARADARLVRGCLDKHEQVWLHMKHLPYEWPLSPVAAREVSASCAKRLSVSAAGDVVPRADDITLLLVEADAAISTLADSRLLCRSTIRRTSECLEQVAARCHRWPRQLCHGDLSPGNVRGDAQGPVVIDWEDAIWGVAGYDYLYWLTFFSNRRWLVYESLGHTPLDIPDEVAVMTMIILLKCALSVRNGTYLRNELTFDQRLAEVFTLRTGAA